MKKLLIATTNKGKLRELSHLLSDMPLQLLSLAEVGIVEEPEENGTTYTENAQIKAMFYSKKSDLPAVADDGGLEIVALNGAPGLRSHRWLGPRTKEEEIVAHMKKIAHSLPDDNRGAFFKTVVSFAFPDGRVHNIGGEVQGIIAKEPSLQYEEGYPYRSFFFIPELKKYYFENEFTKKEMEQYNHRYKAVQGLRLIIQKELLI